MMRQVLESMDAGNGIVANPCPSCCLCGSPGVLLHQEMTDRLFGVPGVWGVRKCSSARCGLLWLDPMPEETEIGKLYTDYHTHAPDAPSTALRHRFYHAVRDGYLQSRLGYRQGVGPRWYRLLAPLAYLHPYGSAHTKASAMFLPAPQPGSRLLDVGCGSGTLLARMEALGWQVEGTEIDPVALELARGRGVPVRLGELKDLGYPSEHFHAIHISHVIEHVPDPASMVRECHRILRPGGALVMLTPNSLSWAHQHFQADWRGLEPPRHLHVFSPRNIVRLLAESEFNIEDIQARTRATFAPSLSASLRDQGHAHGPMTPSRGWLRILRNGLLQGWVRVRLLANPMIGDDIVVIATK